jgi:hypothetical protein
VFRRKFDDGRPHFGKFIQVGFHVLVFVAADEGAHHRHIQFARRRNHLFQVLNHHLAVIGVRVQRLG